MNLIVITGGSHPYEESTPVLVDFLEGAGHQVMLTDDASVLASEGLSSHEVLVFNTLRVGETTLTRAEQIGMTQFVGGGHGFVCIHISGCLPEAWNEYHDVTGGGWIRGVSTHPPYGQFSVRMAGSEHPCAEGIADFVTNDELYNKLGWKEGNSVFLTAELEGETYPMAWTRNYGKGKVFATTLGHDGLSFQTPELQRLILNGVSWAAQPS